MQLLIIPGLGDSGDKHWQTYWVKKFADAVKLNQDDWNEPKLGEWLERLQTTILQLNNPIILVTHSLGVALVAHWASQYKNTNVKGALLVAPADVDSPEHTPHAVRGFAPMPVTKLPFPSLVIASENDTFVDFNRAVYFANQWGSGFVNIGAKGHINADSNLGYWEEGQQALQQLKETISG